SICNGDPITNAYMDNISCSRLTPTPPPTYPTTTTSTCPKAAPNPTATRPLPWTTGTTPPPSTPWTKARRRNDCTFPCFILYLMRQGCSPAAFCVVLRYYHG